MTKQEMQDFISAYDVAIYGLLRTKKTESLRVACSKLATRLGKDQKKLIDKFKNNQQREQ